MGSKTSNGARTTSSEQVAEFPVLRSFAHSGAEFEVARTIKDEPTRDFFLRNRWPLVDPQPLSLIAAAALPRIQKANLLSQKINMYGSVQAGSVTEVHAISRVEGRSSHRRRASPGTTMAAGAGCLRFRHSTKLPKRCARSTPITRRTAGRPSKLPQSFLRLKRCSLCCWSALVFSRRGLKSGGSLPANWETF